MVRYGLYGNDPIYEDADRAKEAQKYKITTIEYLKRESFAKQNCGPYWEVSVEEYANCYRQTLETGEPYTTSTNEVTEKAKQSAKLDRMQPNWRQLTSSAEFKSWVKTLPSDLQQKVDSSWDADALSEIIDAFKNRKASQSVESNKLTLICYYKDSNGHDMNPPATYIIDVTQSTLNGKSAEISDSSIYFPPRNNKTMITIDRYTGSAVMAGTNALFYGKCQSANERKF